MADEINYEYDLFLSYNHVDEAWAGKLAARLEKESWQDRKLKVFFAPWDISPGESVDARLEHALEKSRKVGLIMSPESVASEWVNEERYTTHHIDTARRERRLLPLYRRTCDIPPFLQSINRIDFRDDDKFDEGYRLLLATIKGERPPRGLQEPSTNAISLPPAVPRPPVVGFVARRDEEGYDIVELLEKELAPEQRQLIALCGPGGVGKTTLAAEAVRALSSSFVDRLAWISADGRPEFNLSMLLDEIAAQLGNTKLRTLPIEQKEEQVRVLVAAAPTLIVLDNFETVADAEQSRCADWLNRTSCSAIITSRDDVEQARPVNIFAMSLPEARIFVERLIAQARRPPAFKGLDHDSIIVAADRNPLVLQWIIKQIDKAKQPHVVLQELSQGEGDAAQRVFGRSYELLSEDSRAALLGLSLFVPSASRPALAEVAGFGDDLKRLDEALTQSTELWLTNTTEGNERLTIEGLTRELAKSRLLSDRRAQEYRQLFLSYFLDYVKARTQPTPDNFNELEVEKNNILSAIDISSEMKDWKSVTEITGILTSPRSGMFILRGYWNEALSCEQLALSASQEMGEKHSVALFSYNIGTILTERGDYLSARNHLEYAKNVAQELGNKQGLAVTMQALGRLSLNQNELIEAQQVCTESLNISREINDEFQIGAALLTLGNIRRRQGDLTQAQQMYNESLEINTRLDYQYGIAMTTWGLGNIAMDEGQLEEAERQYQKSLQAFKSLKGKEGIAGTLNQLGILAERKGDKEKAAQLYHDALIIYEELGFSSAEGVRRNLENLER